MSGPPFEPAPAEGFDNGRWVVAPRFIVNKAVVQWGVWSAPEVLVCTVRHAEAARLLCAAPRLLAIVERVAKKDPTFAKGPHEKALIADARAVLDELRGAGDPAEEHQA